jgi:long-chain acyl-CoA synthetase
MHPSVHAKTDPQKPAIIMAGSGETITYEQLDRRSNQGAQLFRALGLKRGDVIALNLENHPRFFEIVWAAQRAGLYYTCVSSNLTASEVEYIVRDCGAKLFIVSAARRAVAEQLASSLSNLMLFALDGGFGCFRDFEGERAKQPDVPIADQTAGTDMLYSSGTTGRPKGVKAPLPGEAHDAPTALAQLAYALFGVRKESVYLSPAPLYHAAPLRWCMVIHRHGGTVVVMEKFYPEQAIALIERFRIDVSQWVPTHFIRMLKLPEDIRRKYDVSSLTCAIHAAAPCPIPVKEAMIRWWGPVLREYYAGTEGNGFTMIASPEWLERKGSVGTAKIGIIHICDENGDELPTGQDGVIFFSDGNPFVYHNDPEKTAASTNKHGWTTLGDIGHVDKDGYLYLTDRKAFMIISGGVNIYPQEIENLIVTHPKVADVAVIGAPDDDMGERVVAVVQPLHWSDAGPALREELMSFARDNLSHVKAPRQVDFLEELPRQATGKLYKRLIRDAYWGKRSGIV